MFNNNNLVKCGNNEHILSNPIENGVVTWYFYEIWRKSDTNVGVFLTSDKRNQSEFSWKSLYN